MSPQHKQMLFKSMLKSYGKLHQSMSFSWFPSASRDHLDWTLLGACQDGYVFNWSPHMDSHYERKQINIDNQYNSVNYNSNGSQFVLSGLLPQLEIVDSVTYQVTQKIEGLHNFHSKRIQLSRFYPQSESLLYSASWDSSIKFWDLRNRSNSAVHKIYGIQVTGDSVDLHQDCKTVAIGGGKLLEGIQIWDLRQITAPVKLIKWGVNQAGAYFAPVTSVKFIPYSQIIVAGVLGDENPAKCFNIETGEGICNLPLSNDKCATIDVSHFQKSILVGDTSGEFKVYQYDNSQIYKLRTKQQTQVIFEMPIDQMQERRDEADKIIANMLLAKQQSKIFKWPTNQVETPVKVIEPDELLSEDQNYSNEVQQIVQPEEILSQAPSYKSKPTSEIFSVRTGSYQVDSSQLAIKSLQSSNKKMLQQQITQREQDLMSDFMKKAEMVQILSKVELHQSEQKSGKQVDLTDNFIQELETFLNNTQRGRRPKQIQNIDIDAITQELYKEETYLTRLPLVKGQIKNVKQLLQQDLLQDGAMMLNVPHSQRVVSSRNSVSNQSFSVKSYANLSLKPKQGTTDYYIQQYQKNMIVAMPELNDKVAENFNQFWKAPQTSRKYSLQPTTPAVKLHSMPDSILHSIKQPSEYNIDTTPKIKQRVPDSMHLEKMKNYLVNAHLNKNFVKQLTGDGLIPNSISQKLAARREQDVEFGESFEELFNRGKEVINKNVKIKELIETGIDELSEKSEEGYQQLQHRVRQRRVISAKKDEYDQPSKEQLEFEEAIKQVNLSKALEMAEESIQDLVGQSLNLQRYNQIGNSEQLKDNQFFKKYAAQYTKHLEQILDKHYAGRIVGHKKDNVTMDKKLMSHVNDSSLYRKKLPEVFQSTYDGSQEIERLMKNNFKQVSPPKSIRKQQEAQSMGRVSSMKQTDPLTDADYVRRLKMANYGKWFLKPKDFTTKVQMLNQINNQQ